MKKNTNSKIKFNIKDLLKINKKMALIIAAIVIVLIAIIAITLVINGLKYKKYEHYEEKMNSYGFNTLYDNGSAKTSEKVTKSEAVKMVIGTCLNRFDINGIAKEPTEEYDNAIWVLYAQDAKLASATKLSKDTADKKATYVEVIEYFAKAKKILLNKELQKEAEKSVKDIAKYTADEKEAIIDLLANDILKVVDNKLNGNKKIFKGQLNELVVNYIEKYDLLGDKIQTDLSKLPNNAADFAYISQDVEKEVYEMEYNIDTEEAFATPKESFTYLKPFYEQIIYKVEKYYNTLLNVDYQTTTAEMLKEDLQNLTLTDASEKSLNEYIDYIKSNQIKIIGTANVQRPIIYYDGLNYRLRTKLDFKIESSLTNDNLLYGDLVTGNIIRYENKDNSIVVDVRMGEALLTDTYYIKNSTLDSLVGNNNEYKIYNPNFSFDSLIE